MSENSNDINTWLYSDTQAGIIAALYAKIDATVDGQAERDELKSAISASNMDLAKSIGSGLEI